MQKETEEDKERINELFNQFDLNHNGFLDRQEFFKGFKQLIKKLSEEQSEGELEQITEEAIVKFDLDKDGQINPHEFTELIFFLIDEKGLCL